MNRIILTAVTVAALAFAASADTLLNNVSFGGSGNSGNGTVAASNVMDRGNLVISNASVRANSVLSPTFQGGTFTGNGATLTSINPNNISGLIPQAKLGSGATGLGQLVLYDNFQWKAPGTNGGGGGTIIGTFAGEGSGLTNITGLRSVNDIWVTASANPSGAGHGTIDDPYDGSTALKFDALMLAFQTTNTSGATIHLLPGTFSTGGSAAWTIVNNNYRFIGSGMDVTTLKVTNNATRGWVLSCSPTTILRTNVVVQDITLDCNGVNNSATNMSGLQIVGVMCSPDRVKVINQIGRTGVAGFPDYEAFGILVSSATDSGVIETASKNSGNRIIGCEVSSVLSNYCSGICSDSGLIQGNRVLLPILTTTNLVSYMAYNCGGFKGLRLIGNYAEGGVHGFYTDTGGCTNGVIADNVFTDSAHPIALNTTTGAGVSGLSILGNTLIMTTNQPLNQKGAIQVSKPAWNLIVANNTVYGGDVNASVLSLATVTNAIIAGNQWDSSKSFATLNCSNINVFDNYGMNGTLASNISQTNRGNFLGTFSGSGASLTNVPAASIAAGTMGVVNTIGTAAGLGVTFVTNSVYANTGAGVNAFTTTPQVQQLKVLGGQTNFGTLTGNGGNSWSNSGDIYGAFFHGNGSLLTGISGGSGGNFGWNTNGNTGAGHVLGLTDFNGFGIIVGGAQVGYFDPSNNIALGYRCSIAGGNVVNPSPNGSSIGGGYFNVISGTVSGNDTISGGGQNQITSIGADNTISGGLGNLITNGATMGTIAGGSANYIGGDNQEVDQGSFIAGYSNAVTHGHSFALGSRALSTNFGAFVWSDWGGRANVFASTNDDSFNVRAQGGAKFFTSGTGLWVDGPLTGTNLIISGTAAIGGNATFTGPSNWISGSLTIGNGLTVNSTNNTASVSNLLVQGIFDLQPQSSTGTNATGLRLWNSNNFAIYVRWTNGVDKLMISLP